MSPFDADHGCMIDAASFFGTGHFLLNEYEVRILVKKPFCEISESESQTTLELSEQNLIDIRK